jgi:hypothetical protein
MLAADDLLVLGEQLVPPDGYEADAVVAATYSLDLPLALALPLALIRQGRFAGETAETADRYATLEAIRRLAPRYRVFHDAAGLHAGRHRALLTLLHRVAIPVQVPPRGRFRPTFHPKLVLLRFVRPEAPTRMRLVCMSRNLTGDAALDVSVTLEGDVGRAPANSPSTDRLLGALRMLPKWSVHPDEDGGTDRLIADIAETVSRTTWQAPQGFRRVELWPLGFAPAAADPMLPRHGENRVLVMSPFLTDTRLDELTERGTRHVLIGDQVALDMMPPAILQRFEHVKVLEPGQSPANGLHAKLYLLEGSRHRRWVLGSANATVAAAIGNAELVVELETSLRARGIDGLMADDTGIGTLLGDAEVPVGVPAEPTGRSEAEEAFRELAGHQFTAVVRPLESRNYTVDIRVGPPLAMPEATVRVGFPGTAKVSMEPNAVLREVPRRRLTRWLEVEVEVSSDAAQDIHTRLIAARLEGIDLDQLAEDAVTDCFVGDDALDPLAYLRHALTGETPDTVGLRFDENDLTSFDEDVRDGSRPPSASAATPLLEPILSILEGRFGAVGDDTIARDLDGIVEGLGDQLPGDFLELWKVVQEVRRGRRRT